MNLDIYSKTTTPKALRDEQATPNTVVRRIEQVMNVLFVHDVCASRKNKKCPTFWSKKGNALTKNWACELAGTKSYLPVFWMNPPYSQLPEFTHKAWKEARNGCIVVGLVPDMRSSKWYQTYIHDVCPTVWLPDGRINFELEGVIRPGNGLPSCFPVWMPWEATTSYMYFNRKAP